VSLSSLFIADKIIVAILERAMKDSVTLINLPSGFG
jgi:hypothetical protein